MRNVFMTGMLTGEHSQVSDEIFNETNIILQDTIPSNFANPD